MQKHGLVVRTSLEPDGRWFASATAVPEAIATAAVAGGDLTSTAAARRNQRQSTWLLETAFGATELEAVTGAIAMLLEQGLSGQQK
jgi:hypothetical protein